jgi:FAD/FMN-containing dehydrogenase/Fe-S oxidoreductase
MRSSLGERAILDSIDSAKTNYKNGYMLDFQAEKLALLLQHLRKNVDGEVRFDATSQRLYSTDASIYQVMPKGVVIPRTEEALQAAVQIALETGTPLTPRGGGTSLSGQSIGPGLIIDCSKYLNQIGPVDVAGKRVRVQSGVVLEQLNRHLQPHGLQFGPDVATLNRATLGGMLGNNSAGSRSLVYGQTVHHVHSLSALASDGKPIEFRELNELDYARRLEAKTIEGAALRALKSILTAQRAEIIQRFPNILRRVSGYNLAAYLPEFHDARYVNGQPRRNLIPLIVGSEGTLSVLKSAELNLVPRPRFRGLCVPHFESLRSALDAVEACLEMQPSAVELIDSMLLDLARRQRAHQETMSTIVGHPAAVLMVEFAGEDPGEIADRIEKLQRRLLGVPGYTASIRATDPSQYTAVWNLRTAGMPLLFSMPGDRKPVTFVEDCAVAPQRLPDFAMEFQEILKRHGTEGAYYGHASVGCLHIRPLLNLKDPNDVTRMRAIMEDVTQLTLKYGGSLSGEHGDGLLRSEWNQKLYGPTIYQAFQQIKRAFDPDNLFNPGKIVDACSMTENLRYGPAYRPIELPVVFDYSRQQGFFPSIELCNGAGVCRKTQGGVMCPSFRATRDERDSTRGRANALRLATTSQVPEGFAKSPLADRWLFDVMDLCLGCKACKSECPSNVDVAKLRSEFLNSYYSEKRRPLGHRLMAQVHRANRIMAPFAPLTNWLQRRRLIRWWMEWVTGIDRRRFMPELHRSHFRKWFRRHTPAAGVKGRVILLDDCFTTYNEPHIARMAVEILEHAGYRVELANIPCCGRAAISKGFLKEARELAREGIAQLAPRIADGTPILGLEPSCLLSLADEWLGEQLSKQEGSLLETLPHQFLYHGHCHQKALVGVKGSLDALRQIPKMDLQALDTGCCGMAGSFGYEREHYDLSVQIAGLDLLPALEKSPEAVVVAPGTSCRHQIRDLTGREAVHPIEVLHAAMKPR